VSRLVPTVLRAALFCLPVAVGHCADALDDVPEIMTPWSSDRAANSNTAMRTVAAGVRRTTLDLRLPDLQSLQAQNLQPPVIISESDEIAAVAIAAAALRVEESPDIQPPPAGIGSLYWAVRHPTQAWRIVLPIQLDGNDVDMESHERAAWRATPETLTEGRDSSANPVAVRLLADVADPPDRVRAVVSHQQ
jgi:hypothetical protein